jgi:monoamine oxidase
MELWRYLFSKPHQHLIALLDELKISYFRQHTQGISFWNYVLVPAQNLKFQIPKNLLSNSWRNGNIKKISWKIGIQNIKTQTKVTIKEVDNHLEVTRFWRITYKGAKVISTLPPHLLTKHSSPTYLTLFSNTRKRILGCGESKFAMEYASPFGEKTIILAHCSVKQASFRKCTTIALLTTRICIKVF